MGGIFKFLVTIAVAVVVYFLFFKKKVAKNDGDGGESSLEMVECAACGTYIAKDEAVKKGGKFYCNAECLSK